MSKAMDGLNVPNITVVGLASFLLLLVIVVTLQAAFYIAIDLERQDKVYNTPNVAYETERAAQKAALNAPAEVDTETGRATIPMDQAIALTVERYAQ